MLVSDRALPPVSGVLLICNPKARITLLNLLYALSSNFMKYDVDDIVIIASSIVIVSMFGFTIPVPIPIATSINENSDTCARLVDVKKFVLLVNLSVENSMYVSTGFNIMTRAASTSVGIITCCIAPVFN